MKNSTSKIAVSLLLVSVSAYSWAGACMPIAQACMKMGYYKGGEKSGKGLVKDCVMPVAMGSKVLPGTNFNPSQLQQCKTTIAQKMKSRT